VAVPEDDQRAPAQVWTDEAVSTALVPLVGGFTALTQAGWPPVPTAMLLAVLLALTTIAGLHAHFG
jgi:hypothetical protein